MERGFGTTAEDIMSSQMGLATRRQLLDAGLSEGVIANRVRSGALIRVDRGVYRVRPAPITLDQELMAAVLGVGEGAVISHLSAAFLWGLVEIEPELPHVTTTAARWRSKPYHVHRSGDLAASHIVEIRGMPVTNPARTVADAGAISPALARRAFHQSLRDRLATMDEYEDLLAVIGRQGRAGAGVLRELVEVRRQWERSNESPLEDDFLRIVHRANLPEPVQQHVIRDRNGGFIGRADFAYPRHRLIIELDGYRYHSDPQSFVRDRNRQNRLLLAGYRVLRYTAEDLRSEDVVIADLHRALRAFSAQYN